MRIRTATRPPSQREREEAKVEVLALLDECMRQDLERARRIGLVMAAIRTYGLQTHGNALTGQ